MAARETRSASLARARTDREAALVRQAGDLLLPGLHSPGVWGAPRLACGCQHVSASVQLDAHAADFVRGKARLHRSQNAQHVSL